MMIGLSYARLMQTTKEHKPYRGTTNKFPYAERKNSYKHFLVEEEKGETVFKVVYGDRWEQVLVSTPEEEAAAKAAGHDVVSYHHSPEHRFYHLKTPNVLGVVRPDDTFQFLTDGYIGQGIATVLSRLSQGYFYRDSSRGGLVYQRGYSRYSGVPADFFPIFHGLRIKTDMTEVHESSKFDVIRHRVRRKPAKDAMAHYADMFNVAKAMFTCMDSKDIFAMARDVLDQHFGDGGSKNMPYHKANDIEELISSSNNLRDLVKTSPIDAMILFALTCRNGEISVWNVSSGGSRSINVNNLIANVKKGVTKRVYESTEGVLEEVVHEAGKLYPSSDWPVHVRTKDGVKQIQY
jgi:hypothetical protein